MLVLSQPLLPELTIIVSEQAQLAVSQFENNAARVSEIVEHAIPRLNDEIVNLKRPHCQNAV